MVGAFFPDVLGGTPEGWAEANRVGLESFWSCPAPPRSARATVADAIRAHRFRGLQLMCRHLGIPWPPEDEAIQIAQRAHRYVRRRVCAAVPGAIEAVRRLRAAGTPLHTASAEASDELRRLARPTAAHPPRPRCGRAPIIPYAINEAPWLRTDSVLWHGLGSGAGGGSGGRHPHSSWRAQAFHSLVRGWGAQASQSP